MQIQWTTSVAASTLHSAAWIAAGHLSVTRAAETSLRESVDAAKATLLDVGLKQGAATWLNRAASVAASGIDGAATIAERLIANHFGSRATPLTQSTLAAAIANVIAAGGRQWASRSFDDEISLRCRPIIEQWEARGPGFMRMLARLVEPELLVDSARISLVMPAAGGHGVSHPPTNTVRFEAVLANPHPQLPEVLRLAWLLAQLQADLPPLVEYCPAGRAEELMKLAMIPATLAAAEEVELTASGPNAIAAALTAWHLPKYANKASELQQWWDTYVNTQTKWPVALAALSAMVPENP